MVGKQVFNEDEYQPKSLIEDYKNISETSKLLFVYLADVFLRLQRFAP